MLEMNEHDDDDCDDDVLEWTDAEMATIQEKGEAVCGLMNGLTVGMTMEILTAYIATVMAAAPDMATAMELMAQTMGAVITKMTILKDIKDRNTH